MDRLKLTTALVAGALCLSGAAPAMAGSISTSGAEVLVYRAASGEANRITVEPYFTADGAEAGVAFSDSGADVEYTDRANCISGPELLCNPVARPFVILHCGDRDDVVMDPYDHTLLAGDCEHVLFRTTNDPAKTRYSMVVGANPVALSHRSATFVAHCPVVPHRAVRCHGALTLRSGKHLIGRGTYAHSGRRGFLVRVALNARGRSLVARRHGANVSATVPVPFYQATVQSTWLLHLDVNR